MPEQRFKVTKSDADLGSRDEEAAVTGKLLSSAHEKGKCYSNEGEGGKAFRAI